MKSLFNLYLKAPRLDEKRISSGSSFQSRITDGKKELSKVVSWQVEYVNLMNCEVDMLKCFRLLVVLKRINSQELDCFAS